MFRILVALLLAMMMAGCSLVQWLPSSSCEHVKYERVGNQVEVEASCRL